MCHKNMKPFECNLFDSKFKHRNSQSVHIKAVHTNKTDLEAHFQAVHNLNNNNHKRSPKDERKNKTEQFIVDNLCLPKSYTCDICDVSLSNKSTLEVHFQQIHNSILAFACDVCFERFPKEDTLSQHKQSCKK